MLLQQLAQSQPVDLGQLFEHDAALGLRVVVEPGPADGEQLGGAAAGGAHEVDVAEPLLVGGVGGGELAEHVRAGGGDACLLAP